MKTFHRLKKEVGLRILEKHNYKCSECGSDKGLCVHHIERTHVDSPEYNNEDNLTVLCRSCHMSYHRRAGHVVPRTYTGRRGTREKIICSIEDCNNFQHGKGLCKKHYAKKFREEQGW